MGRLEKNCLVASLGVHAALLLVVVVGSAFLKPKERTVEESLPLPLSMIPTDSMSRGGGNPSVTQPARPAPAAARAPTPAPAAARPKAEVAPPVPKPPPVERVSVKKAEIPLPVKEPKISKTAEPVHQETNKSRFHLANTDNLVKRTKTDSKRKPVETATAEADSTSRQQASRRSEELNKLAGIAKDFSSSLSSGVSFDSPGGPGGPAFRNYGEIVVGIYEASWVKPPNVSESNTIVQVTVTIGRDGRVIEAHVLRSSGVSTVDRSVRQTLERVREFPPFPEGATDNERTYNMDFNLKANRATG